MAYLLPVAPLRSRSLSQQPAGGLHADHRTDADWQRSAGVSAGCRRVGSHP
jgi:hypothetical protein